MSSEETYLESFIEGISTLPNEIRRNLLHIKSLDKSYKSIVDELREREEEYLQRSREIVLSLPVESAAEHLSKRQKVAPKEDEDAPPSSSSAPTEETKDPSEPAASTDHPPPSSSDTSNAQTETDGDSPPTYTGPKHGIPVPSTSPPDSSTTLVVPTTEELRAKILDRPALVSIAKLRRDAKRHSEEKIAVAEQTFAVVDAAVKKLEVDLERFEGVLKGSGCFEVSAGAQLDDLAAIQVTPNSPDWILAKVISHDSTKTGMYKLSDEDIESNKTFTLPESQVVILGGVDRLAKADIIYAVYPDTTSFYQATVVQAPRKVTGGDSFVMVNFKDDGDENGITHDKAVLMKHIMRVPYGAIQ